MNKIISDYLKSISIEFRNFPIYGIIGLGIIFISYIFCWINIGFFHIFLTPLSWTGYILLIDAIIYYRKKESLIMTRTEQFIIMLVLSVILWMIFEIYNVLLKNWYYTGLPENLIIRYFGYIWAVATILPALFETAELLDLFLPQKNKNILIKTRLITDRIVFWSVLIGLICVIYPIYYPSAYLFGLVWVGFILLFDPINYAFQRPSLLADWQSGSSRRFWMLIIAGYICGFFWEFGNYFAEAKWIYTVSIGPQLYIFDMPIVNFLGFGPFALLCFILYAAITGWTSWDIANKNCYDYRHKALHNIA